MESNFSVDNMFSEPDLPSHNVNKRLKKESVLSDYRKRYQLLGYNDVSRLSDVMETSVPVHGKGNFPTLEVTPSKLVQMVRDSLTKEGIHVRDVRLNGSAATHVLCENKGYAYKDLDLIFAVDLSEYSDTCFCSATDSGNSNANNNNVKTSLPCLKNKRWCSTRHQKPGAGGRRGKKPHSSSRDTALRPTDLKISKQEECQHADCKSVDDLSPCSTSPTTILDKCGVVEFRVEDIEDEDTVDKDSGYTSSGSSVASLPVSPTSGSWVIRPRTHSLDSSSSITSSSSRQENGQRQTTTTSQLHDVNGNQGNVFRTCAKSSSSCNRCSPRDHYDFCSSAKDKCWQTIKDVVMNILLELLPEGVSRARMTDAVLTDAYVQKMVKISNDLDRWSLISLNNDAGRNLELKFVEKMRRQYEFSVDSFQVILDSYQRFKIVSRSLESSQNIFLSPAFYPTVLAESVYGDFETALRHLRYRRICTHRPEEIRGGGLLRYCNLLVRDFTPGDIGDNEVEGSNPTEDLYFDSSDILQSLPSPKSYRNLTASSDRYASYLHDRVYSTSRPEDVWRLEQLMCSRFFIDFNEFPRQQKKLHSYIESHFAGEDDLKFQYLLILRRVVDKGTICLMSHERCLIIDFITCLARETLAKNVAGSSNIMSSVPYGIGKQGETTSSYKKFENSKSPNPYSHTASPSYGGYHSGHATSMKSENSNNNNSNHDGNSYYPHYAPSATVKPNYAPPNIYPPPPHVNVVPRYGLYPPRNDIPPPPPPPSYYPTYQSYPQPCTYCPCCHAVYPSNPTRIPYSLELPSSTMSPTSPPFFPAAAAAAKQVQGDFNVIRNQTNHSELRHPLPANRHSTVFLTKDAKLYYNPTPVLRTQGMEDTAGVPVSKPDAIMQASDTSTSD